MNKKTLIIAAVVLVLAVLGGVALTGTSGDLQGRFDKAGLGSSKSSKSTPSTKKGSSSSSSSVATVMSVSSKSSEQDLTIDISDMIANGADFNAADDTSDLFDGYDLSWVTVGYWKIDLEDGWTYCDGVASDAAMEFVINKDGTNTNLYQSYDEFRLLLRDSAGKTITPYNGDPYIWNATNMKFSPEYEMAAGSTYYVQLDGQPKENFGEAYQQDGAPILMASFCVESEDGSTQYQWIGSDYGDNKYFDVDVDSSGDGVSGGYRVTMQD